MQPAVKYFIEPSLETVVKIQKFSEIHPEENAFIWEFLVYETTKLSTLIYSSPCWVSCWIAFELWQTNKVFDTSRLTKCASWISTVVHSKPLCYPHCLEMELHQHKTNFRPHFSAATEETTESKNKNTYQLFSAFWVSTDSLDYHRQSSLLVLSPPPLKDVIE